MQLIKLEPGDIIDVVAPSYGFPLNLIVEIEEVIRSLGYTPRIPQQLVDVSADTFSANTDEIRFLQLKNALLASDSKLVWCARGGYGSAKLIPQLEQLPLPHSQKIFIGFSDLTALHLFLQEKWGWPTIHGKVLVQLCPGYMGDKKGSIASSLNEFKTLLSGESKKVIFTELFPLNPHAQQELTLDASVIGGNLCLLQTSIGTSWQLDAKDKFVFIEDVDERGYRVERMLNHLTQSGVLSSARAIIFGDFTGGFEHDGSNLVKIALQRFASACPIPVVSIKRIGHNLDNHPLPFGSKSTLQLGKQCTLICDGII